MESELGVGVREIEPVGNWSQRSCGGYQGDRGWAVLVRRGGAMVGAGARRWGVGSGENWRQAHRQEVAGRAPGSADARQSVRVGAWEGWGRAMALVELE